MHCSHGTTVSGLTTDISLQQHGILSSPLGPNDQVVAAGLFAAEDGVNDRLLGTLRVSPRVTGSVDLQRRVLSRQRGATCALTYPPAKARSIY